MTIYFFAGPNGSGKSTIISAYIQNNRIDDVEYICPDTYASMLFADIPDSIERYLAAMEFAEYKRNRLLDERASMIIETVLSTGEKLDFLRLARERGYTILSVFVGTSSPQINIERVNKRVRDGGHSVPPDKIISRYKKSMQNLPHLAELSDELYIYDNSDELRLVSLVINGVSYCAVDAPEWAKL